MEREALRLLISSKLAGGKLPLESFPNVCGGPGNGETCGACGTIVTKQEFVIEGVSLAGGREALYLHAGCFWVWEAERRPLKPSCGSTSPPATGRFHALDAGTEGRRDDGPHERERFSRSLAWRRVVKIAPKMPARHSLSYVGAVALFALGVLTLTLVAADQRSGRGPTAASLRPGSAEITRLLTPVEPALSPAERGPTAGAARVSASGDYARPGRSAWSAPSGRKALSPPASVRRRGTAALSVTPSLLTGTGAKATRWVGYLPEVKAGKAIVRWVKSQPPADGQRLVEPDRHQTR
jgi:hypothetical protein